MSILSEAHRKRIGRRLRLARKAAGLSHDQLAVAARTTRSHLIKLEKGQHVAGDELAARIAKATGRTVEYLAGEGADDDDEEADPAVLMRALMKSVSDASAKQAVAEYIATQAGSRT